MKGEYISRVIELSGISKKNFAKRVGVSISTVNNWVNGVTDPQFYNQKIVRSAFRLETRQLDELFTKTGKLTPPQRMGDKEG